MYLSFRDVCLMCQIYFVCDSCLALGLFLFFWGDGCLFACLYCCFFLVFLFGGGRGKRYLISLISVEKGKWDLSLSLCFKCM